MLRINLILLCQETIFKIILDNSNSFNYTHGYTHACIKSLPTLFVKSVCSYVIHIFYFSTQQLVFQIRVCLNLQEMSEIFTTRLP